MKRVNYDDPVKNLPDAFEKDKNSNNYKLLQLHHLGKEKALITLRNMSDALTIDNAYGATLDLWHGEKVVLKRGQVSDAQYRIRLKGKLMQNMADGSFPKMIKAIAYMLQCDVTDIHIVESDNINGVIVKDMPVEILQNAGFTIYETSDLINNLLPVGVYVLEFTYEDTLYKSLYTGAFVVSDERIEVLETRHTGNTEAECGLKLYAGSVVAIDEEEIQLSAKKYKTYNELRHNTYGSIKTQTYADLL